MGKSKFLELKNKQMINDINLINNIIPNENICEACIFGQQARLPFQKSKVGVVVVYSLEYYPVVNDVMGSVLANWVKEKKKVSA